MNLTVTINPIEYLPDVGSELDVFHVNRPSPTYEELKDLERAMRENLPILDIPKDCPVTHHFSEGSYGREMLIPKGTIIIGKIHRHAHLNVLMQGEVTASTDEGMKRMKAPLVFSSKPGTQRCVYAHEDTRWLTVHVTSETDMQKIEEYVIMPQAELEKLK